MPHHGYSKRRTCRKPHLIVDEATLEIVAAVLSTNDIADGEVLEDLLDQLQKPISQVSGHGPYDKRNCYAAIQARQARAVIPTLGKGRVSSSMATAKPHPIPLMRICGRSARLGKSSRRKCVAIIGRVWPR